MIMGTVLVQPQRMRRAQVTAPEISLAAMVVNLATRLAQDTEQGGQLGRVANQALDEAVQQVVQQRKAALKNVAPRLADWLLRALRATTGLGPELRVASALDALTLVRMIIDAF